MMRHSPHEPRLMEYRDFVRLGEIPIDRQLFCYQGCCLQYRGAGYISGLIQRATGSIHSHSAMLRHCPARQNGKDRYDVLEVREWVGGRATPLKSQVERYPERIDVYRPRTWIFPTMDPNGAVAYMRNLTGMGYANWNIVRLAIRNIPGLWRFTPLFVDDREMHDASDYHCSHAVAAAWQYGGGLDLVPGTPNCLVVPGHISACLAFEYFCTLVP